ncbi:hypothetical protein KFE98_02140 [bacterium SCSIO 12741]|nr:hypothetical protein KFE98_02140 [bacterium SCSIO 12741]
MKKEERVEEVLNSLEGMKRAEASPFWEERIIQRIQQPQLRAWSRQEIITFSLSGLCVLLLLVNTIVISGSRQETSPTPSSNNTFYLYE